MAKRKDASGNAAINMVSHHDGGHRRVTSTAALLYRGGNHVDGFWKRGGWRTSDF